jgi:hypothetical protein
MANLIVEKIQSTKVLNTQKSEKTSGAQISKGKNEPFSMQKFVPIGLIGSGALLLYLGVKSPSKMKFFKQDVLERYPKMQNVSDEFSDFVNKFLNSSFMESKKHISEFIENNRINFAQNISQISKSATGQEILGLLKSSFDEIEKLKFKDMGGANDFDKFLVKLNREKREVSGIIDGKKYKSKQVLDDFVQVLDFKNGKHQKEVEQAKTELGRHKNKLGEQMDLTADSSINDLTQQLCSEMFEAIKTKRHGILEIKSKLLKTAFTQMRKLLNLPETFVPQNNKIPSLKNFSKLSPDELKPMPSGIGNINNFYLNFVENTDFSKIKPKELKALFARVHDEQNLKDLAFLIDEMRLEHVVAKAENNQNAKQIEIAISKLEYILNKLHKVGKNEFLAKSSEDFEKISPQNMHSKLYYLSKTAKKMGFVTLEEADKYFAKINKDYKTCTIRTKIETEPFI